MEEGAWVPKIIRTEQGLEIFGRMSVKKGEEALGWWHSLGPVKDRDNLNIIINTSFEEGSV